MENLESLRCTLHLNAMKVHLYTVSCCELVIHIIPDRANLLPNSWTAPTTFLIIIPPMSRCQVISQCYKPMWPAAYNSQYLYSVKICGFNLRIVKKKTHRLTQTHHSFWICSNCFPQKVCPPRWEEKKNFYSDPKWLSGEESAPQCNSLRRHGFDSWVRRSPRAGNGKPLQYSCLGNLMDRGGLQSMRQGGGHNWAHTHVKSDFELLFLTWLVKSSIFTL